jgi:hypothetical protein
VNVLVIAEDFVKDQLVLQPIIEAMLKALGSPRAKVKVCKDPRFHGTSEALKSDFVQQALSRHQGMGDLFLLCVDRDGNASHKHVLESLEDQARNVIGHGRAFLGVNAWQEIEV